MKVHVKHHYGAALLTDPETGKTLLLQNDGDILEILGEDWQSGTAEILDEYQPLFEEPQP
jgi:hypothetical protein